MGKEIILPRWLNTLICVKDSMDFERNLEPVRPEFEAIAKLKGESRINPITGVRCIPHHSYQSLNLHSLDPRNAHIS